MPDKVKDEGWDYGFNYEIAVERALSQTYAPSWLVRDMLDRIRKLEDLLGGQKNESC